MSYPVPVTALVKKGNDFSDVNCLLTWMTNFVQNGSYSLTLLHAERPNLYIVLTFLSAIGLRKEFAPSLSKFFSFRGTFSTWNTLF